MYLGGGGTDARGGYSQNRYSVLRMEILCKEVCACLCD